MGRKIFDFAWTNGRKLVVAVVGTTVVLLGVALIFLPGPAIIVIPLGLGILGIEFAWARRVLREFEIGSRAAVDKLRQNGVFTGSSDRNDPYDPRGGREFGEGGRDGEGEGSDRASFARSVG